VKHHNKIPDIEWWDKPICIHGKYHEIKEGLEDNKSNEELHLKNIEEFKTEEF